VPVVCLLSPFITYLIAENSVSLLGGYKFGYELLLLNGMITWLGLFLVKRNSNVLLV
jgi:hypothetical protein